MSDFIGNFLTIIRNAQRANKERVTVRTSRLAYRLAEILKREGYIENCKLVDEGKKRFVRIHLKYRKGNAPAIRNLKRLSTPGRRLYVHCDRIPRALNGFGLTIVSTSRGILTDREARQQRVGGELLCQVW